jgi:hypothetical protein
VLNMARDSRQDPSGTLEDLFAIGPDAFRPGDHRKGSLS